MRIRKHLPPLLLWSLLCGLFFATILLGLEQFPAGDFSGQFHAFVQFQAREILAGRLPLWSPGSFGGVPFAADTQAAVFYPPRWLTILVSAPWRFPYYALQVEAIAHVWLAGIFTYALAYAITRRRAAALLGAVAFGLGGYLTGYPLLQLAILESVTWLPLVLLLLRLGVMGERRVAYLLAAGVILALCLAAGHPQTFLHVSVLAAAYYLFLTLRARWRWLWILGLGLLVAATAVGGGTAVWLPAVRFAAVTVRDNVGYDFVASGLPMLNYVQAVAPGVLSFWTPEYVGITAVILALFVWLGRHDGNKSEILFWGAAALVAAWLALGDKGILFRLVYRVVPGFSLFRQQERLVAIVSFSTAVLAAQGAALWLRLEIGRRRQILKQTALVIAALLIIFGLVLAMTAATHTRPWLPVWARQMGLGALVLALLWGKRWASRRVVLLAVVLAADLYGSTLESVDRQPTMPLWPQPAWTAVLDSDQPARIDSRHLFHANVGEVYGWEDVGGISPLKPSTLAQMEQLPRARRWQLLNVTHVLAAPADRKALAAEPLTPVATIDAALTPGQETAGTVYRFEEALPRAWMVYRPLIVPDAAAAFEVLRAPDFDPATEVVIHTPMVPVDNVDKLAPPAAPPEVDVRRSHPAALWISVKTETAGFLVLSEWHYPGWRATANGERVDLMPANAVLQTIFLPAGSHTIELRFLPADVVVGMVVSLLTLAAAAVVAWRWHPVVATRERAWLKPAGALSLASRAAPRALRLALPVIFLLGFGLRLYTAASQELRGDEAFSYLFASVPAAEIVPKLIQQGDPHSPLHYLALHGWMQVAGKSEFALRYLSIVAGVLFLPLMYQLGRRLLDERLGLLVAALAAVSPGLIWVSQDVRNQYTWTMLLATVATLLLLKAASRSGNRLGWWTLYALASALAVYAHYYGVFALLGHGLYLLFAPARRRLFWKWAGSGVVALLLFLPWLGVVWRNLVAAGQLSDPGAPELARYLTQIGQELVVGSTYGRPTGAWLFLAMAAVAALGAYQLWQKKPGWAVLLAGWLGSAALGIYLVLFQRATFNPFYISVAAPAWLGVLALGMLALWRSGARWGRFAGAVAGVALLVGSFLSLANYYFDPAYDRTLGYRPLANRVAQELQPGDRFVANFPDPSLSYYLQDVGVPQTMWPARQQEPAAETEAGLAALAAQANRIWFVPAAGTGWDEEGVAQRWLDAHTLRESAVSYEGVSLLAYRPLHAAAPIVSPLQQSLGEKLRLNSVHIMADGQTVDPAAGVLSVTPGTTLHVTLLWQALAGTDDDYTVFVHLLAADGTLIAQHDGVPVQGTRHTSTWQPGELLLDRHLVVVPPQTAAQQATLAVGMYEMQTIERQTFAGGQDAIPLLQIEIAAD